MYSKIEVLPVGLLFSQAIYYVLFSHHFGAFMKMNMNSKMPEEIIWSVLVVTLFDLYAYINILLSKRVPRNRNYRNINIVYSKQEVVV